MEPEKKTPEEEKKLAPAAEQKDEPKPEEKPAENKQTDDNGTAENTPSHMCEGVFLVVATRFELATSASRTQRSTKLSHTSMLSLFFKREEYSINILRRKCCGTAS